MNEEESKLNVKPPWGCMWGPSPWGKTDGHDESWVRAPAISSISGLYNE